MAAGPISSRSSNYGEKPRPPVPSRTSSLQCPRPNYSDEKGNSTIAPRSTNTASGETPALSWGAKPTTLRQSLILENGPSLEFLKNHLTLGLSRSYSSRSTPTRVKMNQRSASCSGTTRNPTRAARVRRWAGRTRTVSDWDGLRRVSVDLQFLKACY